jgi:hypothetical protein
LPKGGGAGLAAWAAGLSLVGLLMVVGLMPVRVRLWVRVPPIGVWAGVEVSPAFGGPAWVWQLRSETSRSPTPKPSTRRPARRWSLGQVGQAVAWARWAVEPKRLWAEARVGLGEADATALACGFLQALAAALAGWLGLGRGQLQGAIRPAFGETSLTAQAALEVRTRLLRVAWAVAAVALARRGP